MTRLDTYSFPTNGRRCYYHTGSATNAIDIVKHSHLFGSKAGDVNDPDDLRIQWGGLFSQAWVQRILDSYGLPQLPVDLDAAKRAIDGVSEFAGRLMNEIYRFVCFADADLTDKNPLSQKWLWKEYAGNFKGVRIEFLLDKDFTRTPDPACVLCDDIRYLGAHQAHIDLTSFQSTSDFCSFIDGHFLEQLCYTKGATKWSKEYEFRIGSLSKYLKREHSDISDKDELFFNFNPAKIVSLTVGCLVEEKDKKMLRDLWSGKLFVATPNDTEIEYMKY